MKKILTFALIGMFCISSYAANIDWSSVALSFGGTDLKKSTAVTGYLIALEGTSLATSYDLSSSFSASSIGVVLGTDTDGTSKGSKVVGSSFLDGYKNGDAFALLVTYNDGDKMYYNLSSSVYTLAGLDPNDPSVAPQEWDDFAFNNATSAEKGTLKAGGGWTAVPEPASAMLALAGVAMLIRRRK